jgi:DNA/RNA-binding domain of Phe-tRNA-synthetase-like protein
LIVVELIIEPEIFERFPGMTIAVAVADGIDNRQARPDVDDDWVVAWREAHAEANRYESAQAHPRVAPWREQFKAMGLAPRDYRSSIEALMRRARSGGEPFRISPLVDFYNAVSLRHVIPVGGFDLDTTGDPIVLRYTREGDTYQALDSNMDEQLPAGEVAYVAGNVTLTRHFVWRQSRAGMVRPETKRLFLVAEVLEPIGRDAATAIRDDFADGLKRFFGVEAASFLLDTDQRTIRTP